VDRIAGHGIANRPLLLLAMDLRHQCVKCANVVALPQQLVRQVRTYESGAAGY
jgi:hypothetical protein